LQSIDDFEFEIGMRVEKESASYLEVVCLSYELANYTLESCFPSINAELSKLVCCKILLRLISDIRACLILLKIGYGEQALSIASSIYEGSMTIATIANCEELAKKWIEHMDPTKPFLPAKNLTDQGLKAYGGSLQSSVHMYEVYRQFCWGKHLNPLFQQHGSVEEEGNTFTLLPGPVFDERTFRVICFCSLQCGTLVSIAVEMIRRYYVLNSGAELIRQKVVELNSRLEKLRLECISRWGSESPFITSVEEQ